MLLLLPLFVIPFAKGRFYSQDTQECIRNTVTLLGFLWPKLSTPRVTVFLMSQCRVWLYVMKQISNESSLE